MIYIFDNINPNEYAMILLMFYIKFWGLILQESSIVFIIPSKTNLQVLRSNVSYNFHINHKVSCVT